MWKWALPFIFIKLAFAQNLTTYNANDLLNDHFGKSGNTYLCSCRYKKRRIRKCDFKSNHPLRSRKIEWAHVVSPLNFGPTFISWTKGHPKCKRVADFPSRSRMHSMNYSRSYYESLLEEKPFKGIDCARKVDDLYQRMEADLYNIIPVVGGVNALKKDSLPGKIHTYIPQFGKCDLKILDNIFDPPNHLKGDIARIYFYMESAYPGRVSIPVKTKKMLRRWSKKDLVSKEECLRFHKIYRLQGNINPYVAKKCRT